MSNVIFYEKPGCKGNTRQRALLEAHGFSLDVKSILDEPWTRETLRPFFGRLPVAKWFNEKAPAVKFGEINPLAFDEESALERMISEPILIRRPLIDRDGKKYCGFDETVEAAFEIRALEGDLEVCLESTGRCD